MIPLRDANPTGRFPVLTLTLVAINAILFLMARQGGAEAFEEAIQEFGLVPALWVRESFPLEAVFKSMFMHASWAHLIGNMWFLWIFSDNVEDRLGMWRYLLLYFLSGMGAAVLHVVSRTSSMIPMVGASGAISGILGAYMVFFPGARVLVWIPPLYFLTFPAGFFIALWIIVQLLSGGCQTLVVQGDAGGVAYWAHVGGFVVGWLLGQFWKKAVHRWQGGEPVI